MAQLLDQPELLSGQNQRITAVVLLHGLCKANPTFLQTFGAILTKIIEGGSENESQLLGLLLSGKPNGPEILNNNSAKQILKNETKLPAITNKAEILSLLKVRKIMNEIFGNMFHSISFWYFRNHPQV